MKPVLDFALHLVTGAAVFLIVLLITVGFAGAIEIVRWLGFVPSWLIKTFEIAEVFMVAVEGLLFCLFFLGEAYRLARSLLKSLGDVDG